MWGYDVNAKALDVCIVIFLFVSCQPQVRTWLRLRLNDLLQERQVTYASLSEYDIQHLNKQPVLARQLRSVLGFR